VFSACDARVAIFAEARTLGFEAMTVREAIDAIIPHSRERLRRLANWFQKVRFEQPLHHSEGQPLTEEDSVFQPRSSDKTAGKGRRQGIDARSKNADL